MRNRPVYQTCLLVFGLLCLALVLIRPTSADDKKVPGEQPKEDKTYYEEREARAPAEVKEELAKLRDTIKKENLTFTVGYTKALDEPLSALAATKEPKTEEVKVEADKREKENADNKALSDFVLPAEYVVPEGGNCVVAGHFTRPTPNLKAWDWRKAGGVSPIQDQDDCGSCWVFGPVAAFESSYVLQHQPKDPLAPVDLSEQDVLNCSDGGGCGGGYNDKALDCLVSKGAYSRVQVVYNAAKGKCVTLNMPRGYQAVGWGYVSPNPAANPIPSKKEMKEALCKYGPLVASVLVTPAFQGYTGDVLNEPPAVPPPKYPTNHTICIIGWDDDRNAWLIKNSWGRGWGTTAGYGCQRGYCWIAYDCDNIGYYAKWVVAKP